MQTLGITDSTPRTEGRLKSLFWPAVQTAEDVDYLGTQGFWICTFVAIFSLIGTILVGHPIAGAVFALLFYLGGVGVREHSLYAAVVVFLLFSMDTLASFASNPSILRVVISAVLFSNLRATWIAYLWNAQTLQASSPPRLGATWTDKFADILPMHIWPIVRYPYYVISVGFLLLAVFGLAIVVRNHHHL